MSRLFAIMRSSASRPAGMRSEMVCVVGLRFGNTARRARDQSTYSVLSWVSQKFRSSSSVAKRGIGFNLRLAMEAPLLAVHGTACHDAEALAATRDHTEQSAARVGRAQDDDSGLRSGVCLVVDLHER